MSEVRDASVAIAERLCVTARWYGDRCRWDGADGGDLYEGTGGIGWFLADVAVEMDRSDFARTALGAARSALDWVRDKRREASGGLYGGDIGAAWAAVHAGTLLGSRQLAVDAARDAVAIAQQLVVGGRTGCDLIGGLAGTILALLLIGERRAPGAVRAAADAGGQLVARSHLAMAGTAWPAADATQSPTVGLGHGASGVVAALLSSLARTAGTASSSWRAPACGSRLHGSTGAAARGAIPARARRPARVGAAGPPASA